MGERGGKREGAGRKPKATKLGLDVKANLNELMRYRTALLRELHSPERIQKFITVLDEMLASDKINIRRDGAKMFYEILVKTQPPEEAKGGGDGPELTAEQLANIFRKELEEQNADGDTDLDSNGENGLGSS